MEAFCPACGQENEPIGSLGRVTHYRCRACGWLFSQLTKGTP